MPTSSPRRTRSSSRRPSIEALRSQAATSNTGRGGVRYQPHVFTMKGVARLATVLNTSEALRATDLIIDTFLVVYDQVSGGRSRIAIPEPDQYRSSPESRRAIQRFKSRLANALTALLDTIVDVQSKRTARELGQSLGADAVQNIQDRLRTRGLQNTKLEADTTLVLAQAEQTLAATRKTHAEADSIDIQNLERRIDVVKKLIDMSKHLEPAEFVELMDKFRARARPQSHQPARRRQENQPQEIDAQAPYAAADRTSPRRPASASAMKLAPVINRLMPVSRPIAQVAELGRPMAIMTPTATATRPLSNSQAQPSCGRTRNAMMTSSTPSARNRAASRIVSVMMPVNGKNASHPPATT